MKPTLTPEMIEVAARAMCEAWHYAKIGTPDGNAEWNSKQAQYRKQAEAALSAALSVPAAAVVGEPVAWYREGFTFNFSLGSKRPQNATSNPNEWTPLYAAPSAPDGWQPIETAPRDGTVILARYQWGGESRFLVIRLSNMHRWWVTDHDGLIKHDEEKVSIRNYNFTHWRPLPAPPALGGASHD